MELLTESLKLVTAILLLAAAVLKLGLLTKADGSYDQEDK